MEFNDLINLIIIISLLYLVYLSKYYLPSYFKKKAENLAQLEDVEELTDTIKQIELKFEEKTQMIKSQLDFSNSVLIGLHNEEKQSLIKLHNELYDYYNFLSDISFGGKSLYENQNIKFIISERSLKFDKLFIHKSNIALFIDDDNEIEPLVDKCIELFLSFSNSHLSYLQKLLELNLVYNPYENLEFENLKKFHTQLEEFQEMYKKDVNELVENVGPVLSDTTYSIKKYLIAKSKKSII